jgi:hypothetical protein
MVGVVEPTCSLLTGDAGVGGPTEAFGKISNAAVALSLVFAPSSAHARQ